MPSDLMPQLCEILTIDERVHIINLIAVDHYHGVCHAQFLESVADLIKSQGYLGMFSLMPEMPEVQFYQQAYQSIFKKMPEQYHSIVTTSIMSALDGHYGNHP